MWNKKDIAWKLNENGCHICTSHYIDKFGYARINKNRKPLKIHRLIYEQHNGQIPRGLVVMHKCDNRSCINIEHLKLGTQKDNILDMMRKGRDVHPKGVGHGMTRLSENDVIDIFFSNDYADCLAIKYGVSKTNINHIRNKNTWRHVTKNLFRNCDYKISRLKVADIVSIFYSTDTQVNVAKKYNTSQSNVGKIKNKKMWKHITENLKL